MRKWIIGLVVGLALVVVVGGVVLAQTPVPPTGTAAPAAPAASTPGGNLAWPPERIAEFDAAAQALNLTPTQLFEQLHSGQSLQAIAAAQGAAGKTVQVAVQAVRLGAAKKAIQNAASAGRITQPRADWLLQGLDGGWLNGQLAQLLRRLSGR